MLSQIKGLAFPVIGLLILDILFYRVMIVEDTVADGLMLPVTLGYVVANVLAMYRILCILTNNNKTN